MFHEQYTIRQIVYRIVENDYSLRGMMLIAIGILACGVVHCAMGTMIRMILQD
jgi:hypothetical protein